MKMYDIGTSEDNILANVYRLTANAAQQRGDAVHVATADNKDMLTQYMNEGEVLLEKAFGRYAAGSQKYSMPENWPDRSAEITDLAETFLTNYAIAKWYELNGTGERFIEVANAALVQIAEELNKRSKPI